MAKIDDSVSGQAVIDAICERFEKKILARGYRSYEEADERTKLVCDGMGIAIDVIMDMVPATWKEETK